MKFAYYLVTALMLSQCSFLSSGGGNRTAEPNLSQKVASHRSKIISNVSYQLEFDLTDTEKFSGRSEIAFSMSRPEKITIDFFKGEVLQVNVNGEDIKKPEYNEAFITIPKKLLKKGENTVAINFNHAYSKNGVGLYRYVDHEDQKVYTYTDFEPYDANHMFPCFDQPDLKATYATKVTTPLGWEVISSTLESSKETTANNTIVWNFPESERFSTYVYSLHAGQYAKWESQVKTPNQVIPLRLFARQTLAPFVKINDWFIPTQQGFNFFERYFSTPYPYKKYDQVIVPDFNSGAMENVAAVTFNEERFVLRRNSTKQDRRKLAGIILHEMAHMWFGDLVTMKWWNDLWLNESFATYMAYKAMVESSSEYKDNWLVFFTGSKVGAYWADGLVTTHPIEAEVDSVNEAFSNFDGITYGKGASALKQLAFYLGEENFQKGLAIYFKKHAHGNTELKDFMGAMAEASGKDLATWQDLWLKTAGANTISLSYRCDGEIISELTIKQRWPEDHPTVRPHKTKIGIFKKSGGEKYRLANSFTVEFSKDVNQISEAVGKPCPDIIYPNYEDNGYLQVELDANTIETLRMGIAKVEDDFVRTMLWYDLWELVRSQKMDIVSFLETVVGQGTNEPTLITQRFILEKVQQGLRYYLPRDKDWQKNRSQWVAKFEQIAKNRVKELAGNEEAQKLWFDNLLAFAETGKTMNYLAGLLKSGKDGSLSFTIDQDLRWAILEKLSAYDFKNTDQLLATEVKRDNSKRGKQSALAVEAIQPKISVKKTFFERVSQGVKADSLGNLRVIMSRLFPENQEQLQREFVDDYYRNLKVFAGIDDFLFTNVYAQLLAPAFCDDDSTEQMNTFVKAQKLPPLVSKTLRVTAQENSRCSEIRKLVRKSTTKI